MQRLALPWLPEEPFPYDVLSNSTPENRTRFYMFRTVSFAIYLGLFVRVAVAIWNAFWGPSFGAEADAASFHQDAVKFASEFVSNYSGSAAVFSSALGWIYYLTIDSLFLGSLLSCFAWFASALLLNKIMQLVSISRENIIKAMFLYALLPSSILFTSVTLREAYQLLFVNLAIYAVLRIHLFKSNSNWIWLLIAIVGMGSLHGALYAFGLFIVISALLWLPLQEGERMPIAKLIIVVPLVLIVMYYGVSSFSTLSYSLDTGLVQSVETYQLGGLSEDARTHYKTGVNFEGAVGFLISLPLSLFQYLFEPMPWRISSVTDVPILLENILRGVLIWMALRGLKNISGAARKPVLLVFLCYLMIEIIWSLGTINWGTAARHHLPGMGLLLIAAFAMESKSRCTATANDANCNNYSL